MKIIGRILAALAITWVMLVLGWAGAQLLKAHAVESRQSSPTGYWLTHPLPD